MSKEVKGIRILHGALVVAIVCAVFAGVYGQAGNSSREQGTAGEPYPNMPSNRGSGEGGPK